MAVISKLSVSLFANTKGLEKGLKKARRKVKEFSKAAGKAAAVGITAFTAGLVLMTKNGLDASDQIGKLSIKLGASTEALSEYKHVAELSGVDFNALTKSWGLMSNQISDATLELGTGVDALLELNLSAKALNKLKPEQQFELIADALNKVTNAGDKTRLAMDLFGGRGTALLQIMKDGSKGIREMREEAKALGLSLGKDQVEAAERANDAMTKIASVYTSVGLSLSGALATPLEKVSNLFLEGAKSSSGFKEQITGMVDSALGGLASLLETIDGVVKFVSNNQYITAAGVVGFMLFGKLGVAGIIAAYETIGLLGKGHLKVFEALNPSDVGALAPAIPDYQLGDFSKSGGNADFLALQKDAIEKYGEKQVDKQTETNGILLDIAETLRNSTNVAVAG